MEDYMNRWKIAAVQMDCTLARKEENLAQIRARLEEAARQESRLVIFPECILTGYCFESREEALPHAEPVPGPSTEAIAADCRRLGVWVVIGMLEAAGDKLFNVAVLIGPNGVRAVYRKIHLPFLGVDRFTTPGDQPFAVHDLGGLRIGMTICYDGSFPEAARSLMLQGADLIVLPTNWPPGAAGTPRIIVPARAMENHVYFAAVDRIGEERGFRFIGRSLLADCDGEPLVRSDDDRPTILYADIDPDEARRKQIVKIPGKYELDRLADRRPEMYGALTHPRSHAPRGNAR
jgi:5-aminopentanamidase